MVLPVSSAIITPKHTISSTDLLMMMTRNKSTPTRRPNVPGLPGLIGKKALLRGTLTNDRVSECQKLKNTFNSMACKLTTVERRNEQMARKSE